MKQTAFLCKTNFSENYINKLKAVEAKYQHLYETFETHDDWVWFIGERMAD
jgi:hypothetical protein